MAYDIDGDGRIDPRIKEMLKAIPSVPLRDFDDRETLLKVANSEKARAFAEAQRQYDERMIGPVMLPLDGLREWREETVSRPDGNTIAFEVTRPDSDEVLPAVYYIHGGGMASLSAFNIAYRAFARQVASLGTVVVRVEFRNCVTPSSLPEVAPFPAGLNDCASGLDWTLAEAGRLGLDPTRVVVAGESGGGNLTLALGMRLLREGRTQDVKGLFAMCPYIAGRWPDERFPSSTRNNGILLNLANNFGRMGYGIDAYDRNDPLAWPSFATTTDVTGLAPVVISVNECDPLCDEGVAFYRLLLAAGVPARCRMLLGTTHAIEMFPHLCPEIGWDTARALADFAAR